MLEEKFSLQEGVLVRIGAAASNNKPPRRLPRSALTIESSGQRRSLAVAMR